MSLLTADFDELIERIRQGRSIGHASFEPIYYLVFSPDRILDVKRQTPAWISKLSQQGWDVRTFSITEEIRSILRADPRYSLWLAADRKAPLDWAKTNQSLANALTSNGALQRRLEALLTSVQGEEHVVVMVTDLEALHPYLRIGAIEGQLEGKFSVPTIFLYPGVRTGATRLKFLGFYPEDGNYRSVHVGG
ncbi:MAG TPA: BREX protein BrxB domain-containing protein [Candidatus Deferrimicrobium sp.]|nr:BREX protein BrxB domain-containing protein [Candidatus Deferrimicrobium sp.]